MPWSSEWSLSFGLYRHILKTLIVIIQKKNLTCSDSSKSPQIIQNGNLKKIFEIKSADVTNDTAKTSIKNHIYHYTTSQETVICDSDGVAGN
jgi:hypothetical protein